MIPSRYHVVRSYWTHTGSLSEPYVLDRRDRTLLPYRGSADARAEWEPAAGRKAIEQSLERFRTRLLGERTPAQAARLAARLCDRDADCARLSAILGRADLTPLRLLLEVTVSGGTTVSLNNAYLAGLSGNAYSARYLVPSGGKTLDSVYFFISSYTGTSLSVNDINIEVRPEASAGAATPSTSTLTDSATKDPASATGWVQATGLTASLTGAARYFVIVGDADGGVTDFAVCQSRSVWGDAGTATQQAARFLSATTTSGWASGNNIGAGTYPQLVLTFADGTSTGNPLSTATAPSSSTQQRGLYIDPTALGASLPVFGMLWTAANGSVSGMKVFSGSTLPNGSADNTSTDILYSGTATRIGCLTSSGTPVNLSPGTAYRLVATYSGSTTGGPQRMDIGTGADANLRAAMPGNGLLYWTQDNGSSAWSGDLNTSLPAVGLLIDGFATTPVGVSRIFQNIGTY